MRAFMKGLSKVVLSNFEDEWICLAIPKGVSWVKSIYIFLSRFVHPSLEVIGWLSFGRVMLRR